MESETQQPEEIPPIYFKLHLKILFYLGISIIPVKSKITGIVYAIYAFILMGLMNLFTILEMLDLILNFEDIQKMTFNLCYLVTHVLGSVKMFMMIALRKRFWKLFSTLESGIYKPNIHRGGLVEYQHIKNAIRLCTLQGTFFYSLVMIIISARTIYAALANWPYDKHNYFDGNVTVVVNDKIMPYTTWMPFDYNVSPYYEMVFAFQIFSTVVYGYYIGAADAVICGFMILIKAQFLIVKATLDTLLERAKKAAKVTDKDEDMNRVELLEPEVQASLAKLAVECVSHHQQLIAFCDQAEDDFCYLMLLQFLSSLLICCFQLFQLSVVSISCYYHVEYNSKQLSPGSIEFFSMGFYWILMVFQVLCYCWHGNEVQLVSGEVASYVYNINWLVMEDSVKKTLLLIMMRSQRNCYFTAGKFSLLSLQTFMTILRGAGSYFMFLKQMNS